MKCMEKSCFHWDPWQRNRVASFEFKTLEMKACCIAGLHTIVERGGYFTGDVSTLADPNGMSVAVYI